MGGAALRLKPRLPEVQQGDEGAPLLAVIWPRHPVPSVTHHQESGQDVPGPRPPLIDGITTTRPKRGVDNLIHLFACQGAISAGDWSGFECTIRDGSRLPGTGPGSGGLGTQALPVLLVKTRDCGAECVQDGAGQARGGVRK
jgi:hypothetical protein